MLELARILAIFLAILPAAVPLGYAIYRTIRAYRGISSRSSSSRATSTAVDRYYIGRV